MNYYIIEPEIAGGFGENTVMDPMSRPPRVSRFHYKLDGWLGDELLETVACYIATKFVVDILQSLHPTGVEFGQVEISKSELFDELYPNRKLPEFAWLKIKGTAGKDDFALSEKHRLVVSERVLSALRSATLRHCKASAYNES